jgi:hypothetical protein
MDAPQIQKPIDSSQKTRRRKLAPDTITAIAAVFIALLAFVVQLCDHAESRAFNRMSVRPYLTAIRYQGREDVKYGIAVRNDGLGPAQIVDIQYAVDDGKYIVRSVSQVYQAVLNKYPQTNGAGFYGANAMTPGSMIRAGDQVYLLYIVPSETNTPEANAFDRTLSHITIKIWYKSLYNDPGDLTINLATMSKQNSAY